MLFLESPDIPKPHTIWSTLFWWLDYQVSVCSYAPAQKKAWEGSFSIDLSETSGLPQTSSIWERELNLINWKSFATLSLTPELHSVISEGPNGDCSLVPSWTSMIIHFSEAHQTSLPRVLLSLQTLSLWEDKYLFQGCQGLQSCPHQVPNLGAFSSVLKAAKFCYLSPWSRGNWYLLNSTENQICFDCPP